MLKFLPQFLKNKKILAFIFLFLVMFGIAIPKISLAESWSFFFKQCLPGGSNPWVYCLTYGTLAVPTSAELKQAYADEFAWLSDIGKGVLNGVLSAVGILLIGITGALAGLASELLMWVIKPDFMPFAFTQISGTNANPVVAAGWPVVRDLANMFIVLGFVVIGIATTLRIQEYEAKKLLPKLIIAALLINFSLVISGIFIDASNIATIHFLKTGGFQAKTITSILSAQVGAIATNFTANKDIVTNIGAIGGIVFLNIMEMIIFFLYFFLFLFRYVVLWILVILSPLAFVTGVFPYTKNISERWWNNFIGWCIIGIPGSFFIFLADSISSKLINNPAGVSIIMTHMVPGVLLIAGFLFSLQSSAMGASAAMGAAKWTGGKAWIGTKALGGGLDKLTGNRVSSAGKAISSATGRTLERLGLRDTGTTASANNKQVDEKAKTMANEYAAAKATGDTATIDRIKNEARSARGVRGAAAMKVVADAKDLSATFKEKNLATGKEEPNLNKIASRLKYAESIGAKDIIKDNEKAMPGLAAHNQVAIKELTDKVNPVTGKKYTTAEATREAVRKKHVGMNIADIRNLHESQITQQAVEDWDKKTLSRAGLEFSAEQRTSAKKLIPKIQNNIDFHLGLMPGATPADRKTAFNAAMPEIQKKVRELADKGNIIKNL